MRQWVETTEIINIMTKKTTGETPQINLILHQEV